MKGRGLTAKRALYAMPFVMLAYIVCVPTVVGHWRDNRARQERKRRGALDFMLLTLSGPADKPDLSMADHAAKLEKLGFEKRVLGGHEYYQLRYCDGGYDIGIAHYAGSEGAEKEQWTCRCFVVEKDTSTVFPADGRDPSPRVWSAPLDEGVLAAALAPDASPVSEEGGWEFFEQLRW